MLLLNVRKAYMSSLVGSGDRVEPLGELGRETVEIALVPQGTANKEFLLFCFSILTNLYNSIQNTLNEDQMQLTRDTITVILNYKRDVA